MFDEQELLCTDPGLFALLAHYAQAGAADREVWQDRRMNQEGIVAKDLVRLHGDLIAFGWIEQNTGNTPVLRQGIAACCYRITSAGLRALRLPRLDESTPRAA